MSAPKTKEDLTRLAWITELRRQGHRQCDGVYSKNGRVCALGLLAEVAGVEPHPDPDVLGALAGLNVLQVDLVICRNDGIGDRKYTFFEIADVVDRWFA